MIPHISVIFLMLMKHKLAIAVPIVALVPAFFPIYLHFTAPTEGSAASGASQPVQGAMTASPGFNCKYARSATEVAICQSEPLATLDRELNAKYDTLIFDMEEARLKKLEDAQASWRRSRDRCLSDVPCIEAAYVVRIETLSALLTALR